VLLDQQRGDGPPILIRFPAKFPLPAFAGIFATRSNTQVIDSSWGESMVEWQLHSSDKLLSAL
jgi:hypothetical protein